MAEPELLEQWLSEVPKEQPDELWPPPLWPGHFCKKSLLQLRDSSGLAAQSPPYSFAVRYDLRPLTKQMGEKSAYLMLMDGETLRRIGKGSGLDLIAATKSWIARTALCAPPQLLARNAQGKLTGEIVVQPDPHLYSNSEGVLLMTVVLTTDIKDTHLWQPAGDLMSYRLGSPPVQCGLCGTTVALRELYAHQNECPEVMVPCPRCDKRVLIRHLSAHQKGDDCLSSTGMATQTVDLDTEDVGSQCVTPALLPVGVQTSYSSAMLAPKLVCEEPVAALVPFLALRWAPPTPQVRQLLTEYQLTVSEFVGEQWKLLRVELLDIERLERSSGSGELRHELTQLRPGTKYRLELQLRACDGALGPIRARAVLTIHTLSRLAGFEGLSEEERSSLSTAMESGKGRPESLSVREQATQAGPGFVQGACKSEMCREIGVQAFPKVCTESACQVDPVVAGRTDTACGPEWPSLSSCGVQCKVKSCDSSSQCEVKSVQSSCQAQFPSRQQTGDAKADLEMDVYSGVPGWREVLLQAGFVDLLRFLLVFFGNGLALAGILLAELPSQELWPMLASLIAILPFNALELLFFEMFPPSRRSANKLRIWRRRHPNMNMVVQAAVVGLTPDALQLYRAPMQPGGRRFTGVVGPAPESGAPTGAVRKVPGTAELCAVQCPMCRQLSPIPRMGDLWRSTRFLLYCHLPQLVLASWLLGRRLAALGSDLDYGRAAIHGGAVAAHAILVFWIFGYWILYRCRRRAQQLKVADLSAELDVDTVKLRWEGIQEVLCEAWFVVFHSFDRKNILRIEMLPSEPLNQLPSDPALELHGIPSGHFWISVLSWHRSGGLSMPLAMGHCEIPGNEEEEELKGPRKSCVDAQTEAYPKVHDVGTDPLHVLRPTADAECQNVAISVDAVTQFPPCPVELVDAATAPAERTSSEHRRSASGSAVGCFDLPVPLRPEDQASSSTPEGAKGLWLSWAPVGLQELAPRLVAQARLVGGEDLVFAAMGVNRANFQLEAGRYELLLSCELGHCQAEVLRCPHPRCQQRFWANDLQAHLSRCAWQPRMCSRAADGCDWQGTSDELEEHELECLALELHCRHQHFGCRWVGPATAESQHLKVCEVHQLTTLIEELDALLNEACPDFRHPEMLKHLARLAEYRRFVRPGTWKEWKSAGSCCNCMKVMDRKEKGLQCEAANSHLCWTCMPNHIDWKSLREARPGSK
ncbi:Putative amidase [Durusdinium trenchii]|uniref:Amidase n=2 Tax=Durusdinium trenchii TaxID=1381693 RepID=A0ABP0H6X6_9DINO